MEGKNIKNLDRLFPTYERHTQPLLNLRKFYQRLGMHVLIAAGILLISLLIGMLGYHFLAGLSWIDSMLNASMILGGMGPVDALRTDPAKIFASLYAIYSGVIFLVTVGIIIAPIFHRIMHHFHLETAEDETTSKRKG